MKLIKLPHYNVPVELCEYAISNKLISPVKFYLYFKTLGNKFKLTKTLKQQIVSELDISSTKTIHANLEKLVDMNWIGFNAKSQTYFVRAFKTVLNSIEAKKFTIVTLYMGDFKSFRGFVAGGALGYFSKIQYWNEKYKNKGRVKESTKGGSSQLTPLPYFYPVSLTSISNMLSISLSTAHDLKESASKSKYIQTQDNLIWVNIKPEQILKYSKAYPYVSGKLRVLNGMVFEIGPLLIKPNMNYKGGNKPKHLLGVDGGIQN